MSPFLTTATLTINTSPSTNTTRNTSILDGCRTLQFDGFIPWDNPDNIVSLEVEAFAERLKGAIVLPLLFLIGGPANVINMAVFYKQGLRERINLCLFALSLADELYLIYCMFLNGESIHGQFTSSPRYGPMVAFIVNHNLTGFFGFLWVSQLISAIIASERCFCVVSPLRSQSVLSTRTMAVVIVVVFIVVIGLYFLVAVRYRLVCVYDPTIDVYFKMIDGGEFYYKHKVLLTYLDSMVFGLGLPGVVMISVTVTTVVTTLRLRKAAAWRSESSSGTLSSREVALTKMLIGNSIFFLICVTPSAVFKVSQLFVPDMNTGRRYQNIFLTGLWFLEIASYINSSFNIFIYYSMGSKYRETMKALFCRGRITTKSRSSDTQRITSVGVIVSSGDSALTSTQ